MSGLEPVVALALACNVFQVIGVARETIHIVKQVYRYGDLDPALTDHATRLDDLSKQIQTAMMPTTPAAATTTATPMMTASTTARGAAQGAAQQGAAQPRPTVRDTQLLGLANRCLKAARALREEVKFLKDPATKSRLVVVLKSATTVWRQRRLDKLGKDMLDAEQLLQTGLLARIFEQIEKADGGLEKLDSDLRSFVDENRAGRSEVAELVRAEAAQTRKNVTIQIKGGIHAVKRHTTQDTARAETSLKKHITEAARSADEREQDARLEARRERLLRSLKFDRMNERRNMVEKSHGKTYQWVLRDGSDAGELADVAESPKADADYPWDSFSDWLRSTEPEYWISGKPGSGTTTLVKYLLGHPQTRRFLELWSPGAVLVSHFFWRPGTQMQQSIRGLFCSLLHQLLEEDKASLDRILSSSINASHKDMETDWSNQELQSTLLDVMAHYPRSMALFLDGLDEVLRTEGTLALLNVVDTLKRPQGLHGKVKLCLGARREPLIEEKLRSCPQLRLEHLSYNDLRRYAEDTIIIPPQYPIFISPGSKLYARNAKGHHVFFSFEKPPNPCEIRDWLVTELVGRADGVFLWLRLTAKIVMEALHASETVTDLQCRVDSLPSGLIELYEDMWARANVDSERPEHQERAALYFHLAINQIDNDRLGLTIATTTGMANRIRYCDPYKPGFAASLVESCKAKMRDIEIRCAGLLRINPIPERSNVSLLQPWYGKEYCDLIPYAEEDIDMDPPPFEFVHRTARDFLTDTEEGSRILRKYKISEWHLRQRFAAARLACCRLLRIAPTVKYFHRESVKWTTSPEEYSSLSLRLAEITSLLDLLPEGDEENAIGKCDELLQFCEQLFESGQLFRDLRLPGDGDNFQGEGPESDDLRTWYEVVVKREHEFLLEAASINLNIWPFICAKVQSLELDKQTLSELLLHVCTIAIEYQDDYFWLQDQWEGLRSMREERKRGSHHLGIDSRLKLARLLLKRGACPSLKGPRRTGILDRHIGTDLVYVLETPLKGLISSVWRLDRDTTKMDSNLARHFIDLIRLLMSNGANPNGEEFRVTYQVEDGHLFERPLYFVDGPRKTSMQFVQAYPLSVILARMLQSWKDRFPGIDTFLEAEDTIQDGARLGRLILMLHFGGTPARMCIVEAEEELEEELLWVAREAKGILQAEDRGSYGVPVPPKIQQGLSRALERRHPEGVEASQTSQWYVEVYLRAGMTSMYWGDLEGGTVVISSALLGN
ncbi:hypothetical protein B0T18DRAFT_338448 [Schizothecium vesticola]|uniref:Nephrocystin 3-like N-terminal domain-containing protein n=1 Tax=Schizothecium vesticola TaxID=314040 RepID=A0AA40FAM4_9PEZI|nr:hypothetical protein B0T18DRAFT_338448 [Schizothecium vesticola]